LDYIGLYYVAGFRWITSGKIDPCVTLWYRSVRMLRHVDVVLPWHSDT